MGSFSWTRAEQTTRRKNIAYEDTYKFLIPAEFGGGFVKDTYPDYGNITIDGVNCDIYGILAYWNKCKGMDFDGEEYPSTMEDIVRRGNTKEQDNRCKGINIGCYAYQIDKLKYPLKLVSASYKGTYEDCEGVSYGDPDQGFFKTYWGENEKGPWEFKEERAKMGEDYARHYWG